MKCDWERYEPVHFTHCKYIHASKLKCICLSYYLNETSQTGVRNRIWSTH